MIPRDLTRDEHVLSLHAEDVQVTKRQAVRTVQVRRETRSHDETVQEAITNSGVVIERVPMGHFVDAVPGVREEGDVTVLPVVEEVVVVERRLRLVEEVRIRRVQTSSTHVENVTLRQQHVVVTRSDPVISGVRAFHPVSTPMPAHQASTRRESMTETIVAVYDTAAHAELAVADLLAANVPQASIHRHTAEGSYSPAATSVTTRRVDEESTGGFWSNLFGGATDDHAVYDRTLESGGTVVTVSDVPEHDYESVMVILEKHNPVDIDERASSYTTTTAAMPSTYASDASLGVMPATYAAETAATAAPVGYTGTAAEGGVIQLSEEQIAIGKRVVNRGGTRIRRYVVETPVEESITLHEEKVTLERHAVTDGRPVTEGAFTDRTIELTETAEEAVVSKTARVVEEVSLGKTATDRTETIRDTVRKEEVEIEQIPGSTTVTGTSYTTKV